jgi:hypothetical protein
VLEFDDQAEFVKSGMLLGHKLSNIRLSQLSPLSLLHFFFTLYLPIIITITHTKEHGHSQMRYLHDTFSHTIATKFTRSAFISLSLSFTLPRSHTTITLISVHPTAPTAVIALPGDTQ